MGVPRDVVRAAFTSLFPEKEWKYEESIKFSGRFKGLNATLSKRGSHFSLRLSKEWLTVDKDILVGLVQELLGRLLKDARVTLNRDVYHAFLRHVGDFVPKTVEPPRALSESFDRVNNEYFLGLMIRPNIEWCEGVNRVGYYEYGTDTVSLSRALADDVQVLDYVMYHELLHKKHKFRATRSRTMHHGKVFRDEERKFRGWQDAEKKLSQLSRRKKWFGVF